jgi:hypothetical protein
MNFFLFIFYVCLISLYLTLCLPKQKRFRDKVTRRIFETRFFAQYRSAFIFTKVLIWSLLVGSCLFFSGILPPV